MPRQADIENELGNTYGTAKLFDAMRLAPAGHNGPVEPVAVETQAYSRVGGRSS